MTIIVTPGTARLQACVIVPKGSVNVPAFVSLPCVDTKNSSPSARKCTRINSTANNRTAALNDSTKAVIEPSLAPVENQSLSDYFVRFCPTTRPQGCYHRPRRRLRQQSRPQPTPRCLHPSRRH